MLMNCIFNKINGAFHNYLSLSLISKIGSSIYCWEIEANGGNIGVTTWGAQWRHSEENDNFDIFYLKLTNEMCWLDIN